MYIDYVNNYTNLLSLAPQTTLSYERFEPEITVSSVAKDLVRRYIIRGPCSLFFWKSPTTIVNRVLFPTAGSLCYKLFGTRYVISSKDIRNQSCRLLSAQDQRLGRGGVHEIMVHDFFSGIDWDSVRRGTKVGHAQERVWVLGIVHC
jgi:hypothetical protein